MMSNTATVKTATTYTELIDPIKMETLMKRPRVIAFYSHLPLCGKTSAAVLVQELGHNWALRSFATPIKRMVMGLLGGTGTHSAYAYEMVYGPSKDKPIPTLYGLTSRDLQRSLGTGWGRNMVSKQIWVDAMRSQMLTDIYRDGSNVVIDDLRFPEEYKLLEQFGTTFVRIHREGITVGKDPATDGLLDGYAFDEVIGNTGTIKQLEEQVLRLL